MKLLSIYDVARDQRFLVELIDDELTLSALNAVILDRGKNLNNSFLGNQTSAEILVNFHRLVYKGQELKSKILPAECLQQTQEPIHMVPYDLDPAIPLSVVVKVSI